MTKWLMPTTPFRINIWRFAILFALLGVWQALSGPVFDKFWMSRPSDIAISFWNAARSGVLLSDILVTAHATALGFIYGLVSGLVLGLVLAQSEAIALILKPFILAVYGIPRIALAPVFILWFGIGITSKVMMAALATFLLVFFNTYEGVRSADLELRNVSRVLGASSWRLFWHVTLPNASPWIIAGIRIAIPQALVAATVAEFIASFSGLGYRIMETTNTLDTAGTMRGILVLMVAVMLLNFVLDGIEARILRWRPKEDRSSVD